MARKRKGRGSRKGGSFERKMSVFLSEWWTDGKRDDVFWRAAGSGNRATVRHRYRHSSENRGTYGSYGDLAAIDPIGRPLLDVFTISLKNGYHKCHASASLDRPDPNKEFELDTWIEEAKIAWKASGSLSWIIIHQRTCRAKVVYMPIDLMKSNTICFPKGLTLWDDNGGIVIIRLEDWLKILTPDKIKSISERN